MRQERGQPAKVIHLCRLAPFSKDSQLAGMRNSRQAVFNYLVEARSDSLCGALFCNVLTK